MGRKRVVGLDWLDPENTNQRLWALKYLQAKGLERIFHSGERILPNELPSHNEMLDAGMYIEQYAGASKLFRDMKDAWRQERDRNKKKDSGRQVCVFTLSTATKSHLQTMAKEQKKEPNRAAGEHDYKGLHSPRAQTAKATVETNFARESSPHDSRPPRDVRRRRHAVR